MSLVVKSIGLSVVPTLSMSVEDCTVVGHHVVRTL